MDLDIWIQIKKQKYINTGKMIKNKVLVYKKTFMIKNVFMKVFILTIKKMVLDYKYQKIIFFMEILKIINIYKDGYLLQNKKNYNLVNLKIII